MCQMHQLQVASGERASCHTNNTQTRANQWRFFFSFYHLFVFTNTNVMVIHDLNAADKLSGLGWD